MAPPTNRNAVVSRIAHEACLHAPSQMPAEAWWKHLPWEFAKRNESFELAWLDRLRVESTAALDVAIRTSGASALTLLAAPLGYNPRTLSAAFGDLDFYAGFLAGGDASRFFARPKERATIRVRRTRPFLFTPRDGVVESLRFESRFEPVNPRLRDSYRRHRDNRYAHVRYWRHRGEPRPTVVAIHGFMAEGYALNSWFFALPWFYHHLGLDVALFNLPFHGRRQTRFSPFSGHGFFAGGPSRINEAFAQAIYDFRTLLNYLLEDRGVPQVGATGVSLGGFTTALLAATEPRLAFAIPNVPVVTLADLLLEWEPLGVVMRAVMGGFKTNIAEFRRLLAVTSPLSWRPVLPKSRLMVIGGVGDRLAPPKHSRLLWDHWDRCRLHWFPGSHVLHLDRGAYLGEIEKFLSELGWVERG
ncbi:MAG: alpha/beta hydrolase [Deltaproteobacteria bacterium]|nr:MAG: alpha/beta hydrolase [Deltaproteobacteria bacterium]